MPRQRGRPKWLVSAHRTRRASDIDVLTRFLAALEDRRVTLDAEYCRRHAPFLRRLLANEYPAIGHRSKQTSRDRYISDAYFALVEGMGEKGAYAEAQIATTLARFGLRLSPRRIGKIGAQYRDNSAEWLDSEIRSDLKGSRSKRRYLRLFVRAIRNAVEAARQAGLDAQGKSRMSARRKG